MDRISKLQRSRNMSKIKCKNTRPERVARTLLTSMGLRYRLQNQRLPGRPDIVLKRLRLIVFVHGCFWHQHGYCGDGRLPKSRSSYWTKKLAANKARDGQHIVDLRKAGWKVIRLWECELEKDPMGVKNRLEIFLSTNAIDRPGRKN